MATSVKETGVVELHSRVRGSRAVITSSSCILLNSNMAVTSALVLLDHILRSKDIAQRLRRDGLKMEKKLLSCIEVTFMLESAAMTSSHSLVSRTCHSSSDAQNVTNQVKIIDGEVIGLFKNQAFDTTLKALFDSKDVWKFSDVDDKVGQSEETESTLCENLTQLLVSQLLLIKVKGHVVVDTSSVLQAVLCKGDSVSIVATPFGSVCCRTFLNSVSRGIVSNVAGDFGEVIFTDARCVPGSEGGALYFNSASGKTGLAGMVIAPFCWKNKEWIGLSLVCSVSSVLGSLQSQMGYLQECRALLKEEPYTSFRKVLSLSPVIKIGSSWGSGILATDKLVLTCRHVVSFASPQVGFHCPDAGMIWRNSNVLFKSPDSSNIDLAVLQMHDGTFGDADVDLSPRDLHEGEKVYAVGFSLFDESKQLGASVTSGHVSKVRCPSDEHWPVMVQSSCAVHAGMSGGPLVDEKGSVVGMLVCNTMDTTAGATYPHVNMSIPMSVLKPFIDICSKEVKKDVLSEKLNKLRQALEAKFEVWNLTREDMKALNTANSLFEGNARHTYKQQKLISKL